MRRGPGWTALGLLLCAGQPAAASNDVFVQAGDLTASGASGDYRRLTRLRLAAARGTLSPAASRAIGEQFASNLDYEKAGNWYRFALTGRPERSDALAARLGLARISLVTEPGATPAMLAALEQERELGPAVAQLRGRLLLNAGDYAGAMAALRKAITLALEIADPAATVTIQSAHADLAVAAALSGDAARAASYFALAGSGRTVPKVDVPEDSRTLRCDPAAGILPEDRFIFDVSVNDDGAISRLVPVWANRPGAPTVRVAIQLYDLWRWPSGERPAVWRQGVRIAAACAANGRSMWSDWRSSVMIDWMVERKLAPAPAQNSGDSAGARRLSEELAARERAFGPTSPELLPVLFELGALDSVGDAARLAHAERSLAIAVAAKAPPPVVASFQANVYRQGSPVGADEVWRRSQAYAELLHQFEPNGHIAVEAALIVAEFELSRDAAKGKSALAALLARPASQLPLDNEGRRLTARKLATLEDRAGRSKEAAAILRAADLPIDLCERATVKPVINGIKLDEEIYPPDARARTIEGLVIVEPRIQADGAASQVRSVYEYPAGLFGQASTAAFTHAAASPPKLAGRPFACAATPMRLRWQLAGFEED